MVRDILRAIRSGHWPSLMAAWLHFEVSFMVWLLVGALGVLIAEEFGLTATQKGLLVAVPLLGGAILRVPVGLCSDRFGPKPTGMVLLVGLLLATVWGWLGANTYLQLLGVGFCLGLAGASFAVALPLASRAYPPTRQGLAMGVAASANSGTVLAAFFAPRLGQLVGWHGVFGLVALPILLTLAAFAALVRRDIGWSHGEHERRWRDTLGAMGRHPAMYWLCGIYGVTFGGFVGLCSFLPIFFHDQYGLDVVAAGSLTAACGLASSALRPFGGHAADRVGGLSLLAWLFPVMAGLVAAVGLLPPLAWAAPLTVAAVSTMGFGNGVVFQVAAGRFPKQMGAASGLIGAAGGAGGFLLPAWLGALKDATGTYQSGLLLFAALASAAWISVLFARRRSKVVHLSP